MLVDNEVIIVFENEDLIFSTHTGELLKRSPRISNFLGGDFFSDFRSLQEYETITGKFSPDGLIDRMLQLGESDDVQIEYTLNWKEQTYFVKERICRGQNNVLYLYVFVDNSQNVFELSRNSLIEIVNKIPSPSVLFSRELSKVITANSLLLDLLQTPISQIVDGVPLQSFFDDESIFSEIIFWLNDPSRNRITINAKLFLKKPKGNWYTIILYKAQFGEEGSVMCSLQDIDESISIEEKLNKSNCSLSKIVEVQKHFLAQESGVKPYQLLLNNILGVTDAKLGFIGEVALDPFGKQVLKIHAATDFHQDGKEASKLYDKYVKDNFLFRHFDNLFGACITESKVVLENNPPQNPHTKGVHVPGHPHIDNFLGIPILKGDSVVGLIGLGNKLGGFSESDIIDLYPFASTYSVIIEAFKFETDKMKFQKESLEKALLLSKVADESPDLIVMMNEKNELEYISNATEKFLDKGIKVNGIHRKIKVLLEKTYSKKYRISKDQYRSRFQIKTSSGRGLWLESVVSVIEKNHEKKLFAIIRDVSVQAQIEENLNVSLNKEREFNSFVGDFMNTVSHEFKTPLATILSSLELSKHYLSQMSADTSLEKVSNHFNKIQTEVNILHQLVVQSLDYNRFAGKNTALKMERVSFREFIEDCVRKYGFQFKIVFEPEMDYSFTVLLDRFLIETSLVNLLANAIKYGSEIKPELRLYSNETRFGFEVIDKGIGIKNEELPFVFTPFYRGSNVTGIEGSGYGLVAVKNFVGLHDGEVLIESKQGEGTHVKVCFPQ